MPKNKNFKKLVRARMSKTNESYTTARAMLIRDRHDRTHQHAEPPSEHAWIDALPFGPPRDNAERLLRRAALEHVRLWGEIDRQPHNPTACGTCCSFSNKLLRAAQAAQMDPDHEDTCVPCAGLDGCREARAKLADRADIWLDACRDLLAEAHLGLANETNPNLHTLLNGYAQKIATIEEELADLARSTAYEATLDDDSRTWDAERRCQKCGARYSERTSIDSHYFEPPYDYRRGYERYCLACWLGVGPKDSATA